MAEYKTSDGALVKIPEETRSHLQAHPDVWDVLEEAIAKVNTKGEPLVLAEVDLGRVVGKSGAVRLSSKVTSQTEKLTFAKRVGRDNWSRVVLDTEAPEVSTVVIIASREGDDEYKLLTAYIGWLSEREPTDPELTVGELPRVLDFWSSYALVYDPKIFGPIRKLTWPEAVFQWGDGAPGK